jgi:hypothetical protein
MHRYLLIMLLSLAGFTAVAQTPQAVLISGRILDVGDSMGLPYVNIWGKQSKIGGTTGVDGTFIIYVLPGDTIHISSIGFVAKDWIVPLDISLHPKVDLVMYRELYDIDEVTIMPRGYPPTSIFKKQPPTGPPAPPHISHTPRFGVGQGGGITFGFDSKAKHIREQQQYIAQWNYEEAMREYINFRYNPTFIQQFVPLADEQVEIFMHFCNLPADFIVSSNDYDLAKAIKDCYGVFVSK